jgi:hypothetical protein
MVWAASNEAKFLNGKSVWANWDVDELKAERNSILGTEKFTLGLLGWQQSLRKTAWVRFIMSLIESNNGPRIEAEAIFTRSPLQLQKLLFVFAL